MKHFYTFILIFLVAFSCTRQQPAQPAAEPEPVDENGLAFASLSVINMREKPDYAAELGTQALMGTPVKVHRHDNGYWVNIETPDGYKAWVNDMAIVPIDQERLDAWKASKRVVVTSYYTFFLDAPRPDAGHVSDGVWGDIAEYVGTIGKFVEVKLPDGKQAFVSSADVADLKEWVASRKAVIPADAPEVSVEKARQLILETAKTFLGVPYLWAGTSIKGVDCSGFSKSVYFLNGYMLLRNASQQYKTGEPVDVSQGLDNLQPADLVFFGREATADKPERISHVAIYMGDGKIIHSSQLVRINSLIEGEPDYYSRKPIRACRIIGNQDCGKGVVSIAQSGVYF
ncbi:MAG: C40 family peptidase [Bacteroidales bacterium]|nr:C40 family peptidase [Bacteroidales bacterium]